MTGAADFWRFSLRLYGDPAVEAACLTLQERRGVDVNLLLLACWLGTRGIPLDREQVRILEQAVRPWRDQVLGPLRRVRQDLKIWLERPAPGLSAGGEEVRRLRERVKNEELEAEHVEQRMLAGLTEGWLARAPSGRALITANLKAVDDGDCEALATLVAAATA